LPSLDRPEAFPPTKDIFPEKKLPWIDLIDKTKH